MAVEFKDICAHCNQPILSADEKVITGKRLTINPNHCSVTLDGQKVRLTGTEFSVLHMLAMRAPNVVTKDAIFLVCWGDSDVETKIIDVIICKLRKKLNGVVPGAGELLATTWGRGYSLDLG